jgi:C1A family cysteine protease
MLYPFLSKLAKDPETEQTFGTGWLPPFPDLRDYEPETKEIKEFSKKLGFKASVDTLSAPAGADLRADCSPVENQLSLGSCTAQAAVGIVEYYERRAFGRHLDGSRLFVYKTTRNLMGVVGDTGAWLRNVIGALALCGVPSERYWPYVVADFDNEPSAFVYSIANNYEAIRYFCHDPLGSNRLPADVLKSVKVYLTAGIPSMFGFYGFPSFGNANAPGNIPYPCPTERAAWGHAIVAVGFDDTRVIVNTRCNKKTTGALLIRNSWGTGWGDQGYGWLPYAYVLSGLAVDFWSLLSMKWVDSGQFHF